MVARQCDLTGANDATAHRRAVLWQRPGLACVRVSDEHCVVERAAGTPDAALPSLGEKLLLVPALNPDVALIHVQRCDCYGNAQIDGLQFMDLDLAMAAADALVAEGGPSLHEWTASGLRVDLPVGGSRTLFMSGDVALRSASRPRIRPATTRSAPRLEEGVSVIVSVRNVSETSTGPKISSCTVDAAGSRSVMSVGL